MIAEQQNELYPIFLKVHQLNVLIVGGGNVALEKLGFLLKSSPNAKVTLLAKEFDTELLSLAKKHHVKIKHEGYHYFYLQNQHLVIGATDDREVNKTIQKEAKIRNILVNIADTPELCDFYLGGIVTKGNVKIAISTNGKSPTMAKRLRQLFEEVIPDDINSLAENLNTYRQTLKVSFKEKVAHLNQLTKSLITE
jgi:precorrin-2 dehydrogenase/sirohydrochlorin ferrochelatase